MYQKLDYSHTVYNQLVTARLKISDNVYYKYSDFLLMYTGGIIILIY